MNMLAIFIARNIIEASILIALYMQTDFIVFIAVFCIFAFQEYLLVKINQLILASQNRIGVVSSGVIKCEAEHIEEGKVRCHKCEAEWVHSEEDLPHCVRAKMSEFKSS